MLQRTSSPGRQAAATPGRHGFEIELFKTRPWYDGKDFLSW
jgi:hypothetical protein